VGYWYGYRSLLVLVLVWLYRDQESWSPVLADSAVFLECDGVGSKVILCFPTSLWRRVNSVKNFLTLNSSSVDHPIPIHADILDGDLVSILVGLEDPIH
jgi:hypothetical protein